MNQLSNLESQRQLDLRLNDGKSINSSSPVDRKAATCEPSARAATQCTSAGHASGRIASLEVPELRPVNSSATQMDETATRYKHSAMIRRDGPVCPENPQFRPVRQPINMDQPVTPDVHIPVARHAECLQDVASAAAPTRSSPDDRRPAPAAAITSSRSSARCSGGASTACAIWAACASVSSASARRPGWPEYRTARACTRRDRPSSAFRSRSASRGADRGWPASSLFDSNRHRAARDTSTPPPSSRPPESRSGSPPAGSARPSPDFAATTARPVHAATPGATGSGRPSTNRPKLPRHLIGRRKPVGRVLRDRPAERSFPGRAEFEGPCCADAWALRGESREYTPLGAMP